MHLFKTSSKIFNIMTSRNSNKIKFSSAKLKAMLESIQVDCISSDNTYF